ncbi:uncharacterized protein LOC124165767 [Ischnura elegans]|uniref:uncharacterized protein LOC124165767 n=1 Tax=Ischnura elegans TaxID=197161 RepID=UPI001ED8BA5C|nr:uncharacterized protein LOC124165767 [Ischnura elegans]
MVDKSLTAFPSVLKDTSRMCEQIAIKLRDAKANLEIVRKNQNIEKVYLRKMAVKKLRSERRLCCLEELILMLKNELSDLDKEKKEILQKISSITWSQSKADLIVASERKLYDGKEEFSQSFITENEAQDLITSKNSTSNGKEEKSKLNEKKTTLEEELNEINSKITKTASDILSIEQENRVLQKRNSALLLRLQKQLKETETRRNLVAASLETIKHDNGTSL